MGQGRGKTFCQTERPCDEGRAESVTANDDDRSGVCDDAELSPDPRLDCRRPSPALIHCEIRSAPQLLQFLDSISTSLSHNRISFCSLKRQDRSYRLTPCRQGNASKKRRSSSSCLRTIAKSKLPSHLLLIETVANRAHMSRQNAIAISQSPHSSDQARIIPICNHIHHHRRRQTDH